MFYMLLANHEERDALIAYLKKKGILSVFHYVPLHTSPMGRRFGGKDGDCPITEDTSERLLRLPLYNSFAEAQQMEVVSALLEFTGWQPQYANSRQARV